jgi:lysylphosphatidylglycerol synthetase-like protein (DUF2156 family)
MFMTISDLTTLILISFALSGWTLGVLAIRWNFSIGWRILMFAWFAFSYWVGWYALVPESIRWQWESTPEHRHAFVTLLVGFAIALTTAIWGGGLMRMRSKPQKSQSVEGS